MFRNLYSHYVLTNRLSNGLTKGLNDNELLKKIKAEKVKTNCRSSQRSTQPKKKSKK